MNQRETVAQKMRRWADESEAQCTFPTMNANAELGVVDRSVYVEERRLFSLLADMIEEEQERFFIPRPLFEDGEPVQFGDRYINDFDKEADVSSIAYTYGLERYVFLNSGKRRKLSAPVKRPASKVLDADGIEIKVGDTVYEVETGHESKVLSNTMIDSDGNRIRCSDGCQGELHYKPEELTHREPDTLEKLRKDATMPHRAYYNDRIGHDVGLKNDDEIRIAVHSHLISRAIALAERGA